MVQPDRLHELYEQGLTTLEEERTLSQRQSIPETGGNPWFDYIKLKRNAVPSDIEQQVWAKVDAAQQKTRQVITSILTAAASVLLITVLITSALTGDEEKLRTREIAATLEEAISMIPANSEVNATRTIIYEDEAIVIYVEK